MRAWRILLLLVVMPLAVSAQIDPVKRELFQLRL